MPPGPPCADCRPERAPANEPAVALYQRVADNWLVDPMGLPLGLSVPAIEAAMNIMGIDQEDRPGLLEAVQTIGRVIREEVVRERKRRQDEDNGQAPGRSDR